MKSLVIADIHGNATALRAVLEAERDFDQVLFLGDTAFPGPQVMETIDLLSDLPGIFIRGNHDDLALNRELLTSWPQEWQVLYDAIYSNLDDSYFEFFRSLSDGGLYAVADMQVCLRHGYVPEPERHVIPSSSDDLLAAVALGDECPITLFGHSHIQFQRTVGNRTFINPGSVGQNRCGKVVACYGVFNDSKFEHRHVPYDPQPILRAFDQIKHLNAYPAFRDWLKSSILSGYGVGKREPWISLAAQGYY